MTEQELQEIKETSQSLLDSGVILFSAQIENNVKLVAEVERLQKALEYYADEKHYEPYGFDSYGCDVTEDGGMIARQTLAGE